MKIGTVVILGLAIPVGLGAQDTTHVLDQGVRVGITYAPGSRPALVVLPAPGLDSLQSIIQRDLDYSDVFDLVVLPAGDPLAGAPRLPGNAWRAGLAPPPLNYQLYQRLGADYALELLPGEGSGVLVRLHQLVAGAVKREQKVALPSPASPEFRQSAHRLADEVVRWVTGTPGIAATRIAFIANKRLYLVDSDGTDLTPLSGDAETALSPAWAPDGQRIAYTAFNEGQGTVAVLTLATLARRNLPGTGQDLNITPSWSPDGLTIVFARSNEEGTDLFSANVADWCCVQRLTVGRFADNLSPTYSPDGRQVAFVSTRAGLPQIYVMAPDGTDQELLAPFDFGASGSSNAPEWSPGGASVVFHREVSGTPQLFLVDVASRRVRQLTSSGRNTDASWAPDGRHLVFVSDRTGRRQLWIIDVETGRIRQLTTVGTARLPAWSRRLSGAPLAR